MIGVLIIGSALIVIGFWGVLTRRNLIKIVLSIAIAETGLQLAMISIGFIKGGTARQRAAAQFRREPLQAQKITRCK